MQPITAQIEYCCLSLGLVSFKERRLRLLDESYAIKGVLSLDQIQRLYPASVFNKLKVRSRLFIECAYSLNFISFKVSLRSKWD